MKSYNVKIISMLILIMFVALWLSNLCCAKKIYVNTWGGYATLKMKDANKYLNELAEESIFSDYISIGKIMDGLIYGIAIDYKISNSIGIRKKIEYINCSQGVVAGNYRGILNNSNYVVFKDKLANSLIPIMLGIGINEEKTDYSSSWTTFEENSPTYWCQSFLGTRMECGRTNSF